MLVKPTQTAVTKGARFPGRYIQGPGSIVKLGTEPASYGAKAAILLDNGIFNLLKEPLTASCNGKIEALVIRHC